MRRQGASNFFNSSIFLSSANFNCNALATCGVTNLLISPPSLQISLAAEEETTAKSGLVGRKTVSISGARTLLMLAKLISYSKSETDLMPRIRTFALILLAYSTILLPLLGLYAEISSAALAHLWG